MYRFVCTFLKEKRMYNRFDSVSMRKMRLMARKQGNADKRRVILFSTLKYFFLSFMFTFCLCIVQFLVIAPSMSNVLPSGNKRLPQSGTSQKVQGHSSSDGRAFTRVTLVMDAAFAHAWLNVVKRNTYPVEIHVENLIKDHDAEPPRVVSRQTGNVRATFYGKSSLKLKYTKRRSVLISSDVPFNFTSPSPVDPLHPGDLRDRSVSLKDFLLLSLWEDEYRLSYRSTMDLLRPLDLFFSYGQLADLRCFPAGLGSPGGPGGPGGLGSPGGPGGLGGPGGPSRHPCAPAGGGTDVRSGARRGRALGAYLVLELPLPAIRRRMRAAFDAFEAAGDNESAAQKAPALSRRVFETPDEYAARLAHWRAMWRQTKDVFNGDEGAALEVATPDNMFLRPPKDHTVRHVPSYQYNSSYLTAYKRMVTNLEHLGYFDVGDGANTTRGSERFVDLPQYFAWIAINMLLHNGDYNDEVYFFGMFPVHKNGESSVMKGDMPIYLGLMAWDFDSIFHKCHRRSFFKAPLMFCAETSVDYRIFKNQHLYKRYTQILYQMLKFVGTNRFARSAALANRELQAIFAHSPETREATFGPNYDPAGGLNWITTNFEAQRQNTLKALAPIYGVNALHINEVESYYDAIKDVLPVESLRKDNAGTKAKTLDNNQYQNENVYPLHLQQNRLLGGSNTALGREVLSLRKRLASLVQFSGTSISTDYLEIITARGPAPAMPVVCPGPECSLISTSGLYCARVVVPLPAAHLSSATFAAVGVPQEKQSSLLSLTAEVPLCRPNPIRGSSEMCMADFVKPDPLHLAIPPAETKASSGETVLHIIVPHVWPRAPNNAVFIARVFHRSKNNGSLRWDRRNMHIKALSANPIKNSPLRSNSMLPRGFAAVRLTTSPHSHLSHARGPLLHVVGPAFVARVEVFGLTAKVSLADIARPPKAPPRDKENKFGLFDGTGVWHGDTLSAPRTLRAQCPVFITKLFTVERGATLEIPAGCTVVMHSAAAFSVNGILRFLGTADAPIVVTSPDWKTTWRTIHVQGETARLESRYTFITGSGQRGKIVKGTGSHHTHSAAVSATDRAAVALQHTFFVELKGPAIAAGSAAAVRVSDTLVQWAQMGIECKICDFASERSVWTHFPSWDAKFADNDNDALYLSGGEHRVVDTVIAHTKDDGIDTGMPNGDQAGGTLLIDNTIIESCMHEGIALSSSKKGKRVVLISRSLVQYCQQGVELGYTSPHMSSALTSSLVQYCNIGVRYGDNYNWYYEGELILHNTTLAHNQLNVLNFERQFSSPRGPSYFRADGTIPARHVELLPNDLAKRITASSATFVALWPDELMRESKKENPMCLEFFTLPTLEKSALHMMDKTLNASFVREDTFIHDVFVKI